MRLIPFQVFYNSGKQNPCLPLPFLLLPYLDGHEEDAVKFPTNIDADSHAVWEWGSDLLFPSSSFSSKIAEGKGSYGNTCGGFTVTKK